MVPQPDYSGHSMLALYPPPEVARQLAIPGGLDPADLHLTVAYTGPADGVDRKQLRKATKRIADRPPIPATIAGHARLTGADAQDVIVALVDGPALDDLRADALGELDRRGIDPARNHSTLHHITLAYVDPGDPDPVGRLDPLPATFAAVSAVHATDRRDRPFDSTLPDAAREAFAAGWALSGGPVDETTAVIAEAAVRVALENSSDPGVLEATLNLGTLKGLLALFFARREAVIDRAVAELAAAWSRITGRAGVEAAVDRMLAELGPAGMATAAEQAEAAASAAASLLSAVYAAEDHGPLRDAMTDALRSALAEGEAGTLALNAEQAGLTVVTGRAIADGVFGIDTAYDAVWDRLASLPDLPLMADRWIQAIVRGAASDVGKLLARLNAAQTSRKEIVAQVKAALDAKAKGSVSARAVGLLADQAVSQAMSQAALDLYSSEGVTDVWFVTAGDSMVCPVCQDAEDNSPYTPQAAPVPGLHPRCRCVLTVQDPAPFTALVRGLA
jgi:2'-5' RNA ligase